MPPSESTVLEIGETLEGSRRGLRTGGGQLHAATPKVDLRLIGNDLQ